MIIEPVFAIYKHYGYTLSNLIVKANKRRNDTLKLIAVHKKLAL